MTPRLIIIEGADNTGKTTLAKFITNTWNREGKPTVYFHFDYNEMLGFAMYQYQMSVLHNLLWNLSEMEINIVLDRSWISELVYGTVMGPAERLIRFNYAEFRKLLDGYRPLYIYAKSALSAGLHQVSKHNHEKYTMNQYREIELSYDSVMSNMRNVQDRVVDYDMEKWGSTMAAYLETVLNARENL